VPIIQGHRKIAQELPENENTTLVAKNFPEFQNNVAVDLHHISPELFYVHRSSRTLGETRYSFPEPLELGVARDAGIVAEPSLF
jgi:hypothetical protein